MQAVAINKNLSLDQAYAIVDKGTPATPNIYARFDEPRTWTLVVFLLSWQIPSSAFTLPILPHGVPTDICFGLPVEYGWLASLLKFALKYGTDGRSVEAVHGLVSAHGLAKLESIYRLEGPNRITRMLVLGHMGEWR